MQCKLKIRNLVLECRWKLRIQLRMSAKMGGERNIRCWINRHRISDIQFTSRTIWSYEGYGLINRPFEPACKVSVLSKKNLPYKRTDLISGLLISIRVIWLGLVKNWPYKRIDLTSVDHLGGLDCTYMYCNTFPNRTAISVRRWWKPSKTAASPMSDALGASRTASGTAPTSRRP